jgi:dCTP deaminase
MLADSRIRELIQTGEIGFERIQKGLAYDMYASRSKMLEQLLQPASIEVTLSPDFLSQGPVLGNWVKQTASEETPALLMNGRFALASTAETIRIPDFLVGRIEGKSTLARQGLVVHSTAGFIDPGFIGTLTLELSNVSAWPIRLSPGMKIAQISFEYVDGKVDIPYGSAKLGSHYQGQSGPTAAAA